MKNYWSGDYHEHVFYNRKDVFSAAVSNGSELLIAYERNKKGQQCNMLTLSKELIINHNTPITFIGSF
jgi:hypothetical protein